MAKLFRAPVKVKDEATGKRVPKLDAEGKPVLYPKWSAVIVDHKGRRKTYTFTANQKDSQRMANMIEAREHEIRSGVRAAPESPKEREVRSYAEVVEEYLAWGNAQGGRGGRPWSKGNARLRKYCTDWWGKTLKITTLDELGDKLGAAERALRKLQAAGRAGKTLNLYREGLVVLCRWCIDRGYMQTDPFRKLGKFAAVNRNPRRPLPPEDIHRLLASVKLHRQLLYETAFSTGFRAGELRSLTLDSLDHGRCGIRLSADVDKGRQERLQPAPADLLRRLEEFGRSGEALRLYQDRFAQLRQSMPDGLPEAPLLYVPLHPHLSMKADLEAIGIPYKTKEGKVDFHACRTTYINLVVDSGADLKTAQTLARHSTPELTMNTYAKAKKARLDSTAEALGRVIRGGISSSPAPDKNRKSTGHGKRGDKNPP